MNENNIFKKINKKYDTNSLLEPLTDIQKIAVRSYLREEIQKNNEEILGAIETSLRSMESACMKYRKSLADIECIYDLNMAAENMDKSVFDIKADINNNVFCLEIPGILPHRRNNPNVIFIEELRKILIETVINNRDFHAFSQSINKECVVVFEFGFMAKNMIRDADNIECKAVIDVLTEFIIPSDNGGYMSLYKTCGLSASDKTIIKIMGKKQFLDYILGEK